uniref:beta-N-acetylhexosaminidase n=1 Tax=Romanomermis culicivorax TaxID=13658 RepID=A0A915IJ71_ROMCU
MTESELKREHETPKIDITEKIQAQLRNLGGSYTRPTNGFPWPMPQKMELGPENMTVSGENFKFISTLQCDILDEAITRYKKIIFASKESSPVTSSSMVQLNIDVETSCEKYPHENMNENYTLWIWRNGTGLLKAPSIWGALRGLETFSQLFYSLDLKQLYIRTAEITDYPRFGFRGILIDTSRHFVEVPTLLKNLDLMAQNKMNVFHWHIVDDQSFPYESILFPLMSLKGAFTQKHVYTVQDMQKVVEYARLRGIRVVPEFDTPGHTLSWGAGQSGLLTPCYSSGKPDGTFGPIDPTKDSNYDFLMALFREILTLFPDKYVHLGGDEVSFDCWASNPKILEFMNLQGFGNDFAKLEEYYIQHLLSLVRKARNDTGYLVWQEVVDNGVQVKPDTVVHVWKGNNEGEWGAELDRVTVKKLKAVLSSCWYLNYISYGTDWYKYYQCDPQKFTNSNDAQKELVSGILRKPG